MFMPNNVDITVQQATSWFEDGTPVKADDIKLSSLKRVYLFDILRRLFKNWFLLNFFPFSI